MRGLGTAVMHGTTLAILAAIAHELAERETREAAADFNFHPWWFVPGFLVAVAHPHRFNQFPDRPMLAMLGAMMFAPVALMAIFSFGTSEAQRGSSPNAPSTRRSWTLCAPDAGPTSPAGSRIAALPGGSTPSPASGSAATGSSRPGWSAKPKRR